MSENSKIVDILRSEKVEYLSLEECCTILDKKRKPVTKAARQEGEYPYYGANGIQDYVSDYIFDGIFILVGEDGSVITELGTPIVNWAEGKIWVNNHAHIIESNGKCDLKYLYYYLQTVDISDYVHGNIPKFTQGDFKNLKIAVPPMEMQKRIVSLLEDFTLCSEELVESLNSEIELRQKQYDFYKDKILAFDGSVDIKTIGEITTIVRGASPRPIKNFVTDSDDGVNWIKIGDAAPNAKYIDSCVEKITIEGAKKSRSVKAGDFILSNSMSFGRPYILKIDGCIHDGWLAISDFEEYLIPDFLYHVLTSNAIQEVMRKKASFGGAVQNLNADIVRSIEIPIPSIEKQKEIVAQLDGYSDVCNSLINELRRELIGRKKQYTFYCRRVFEAKDGE